MNLSRGLKGLLAATLLGALVAVTTAPFPALAATETYRDEFNSGDFTGSDGTLGWPAPWIEVGESDGPDSGLVEVVSVSGCAASPCVRIRGGVVSGGQGLRRYADLSSASSATLSMRTVRTGSSS
ncbi:MAG TPA: hypothetical protein EYP73_03290, partial [Acidimicrobiia bacterium]|nr:hypothetical protein [Acidimicrobiia bacterium]